MEKVKNWELNLTDDKGNIITGYQDVAKDVTKEQAIIDYIYYLETSEGKENLTEDNISCIEIY